MSWREEVTFHPGLVTWAFAVKAVDTRQGCEPALEAQRRQGCCGSRDRPCRFLARLILRAPYQKWRFFTDSSVTSVPSHLLARGRHALLQVKKKKKNHYVELACLQWFNWNKMCAPLSGTACAEEPG